MSTTLRRCWTTDRQQTEPFAIHADGPGLDVPLQPKLGQCLLGLLALGRPCLGPCDTQTIGTPLSSGLACSGPNSRTSQSPSMTRTRPCRRDAPQPRRATGCPGVRSSCWLRRSAQDPEPSRRTGQNRRHAGPPAAAGNRPAGAKGATGPNSVPRSKFPRMQRRHANSACGGWSSYSRSFV